MVLVPFSTSLRAEFIHYRIAQRVYRFNILPPGLTLCWSWSYATRAHLLGDDLPAGIHPAVGRRIVMAQALSAAQLDVSSTRTTASPRLFWSS